MHNPQDGSSANNAENSCVISYVRGDRDAKIIENEITYVNKKSI